MPHTSLARPFAFGFSAGAAAGTSGAGGSEKSGPRSMASQLTPRMSLRASSFSASGADSPLSLRKGYVLDYQSILPTKR